MLNVQTEICKLLTDLEYEKENTLYDIIILKSNLIRLEIPPIKIDKIKSSGFSS